VVTSAQFLLDSESRLQSAIQTMLNATKPESTDSMKKNINGMKMKDMQMDGKSTGTHSRMNLPPMKGMKMDNGNTSTDLK
jgi:uncharacterized protein involved in copper resistance